MKTNSEYYCVMNKNFATTLSFLYGFKYFIFDHKEDSDKKVYSFENTPELQEAIATIMRIRNK